MTGIQLLQRTLGPVLAAALLVPSALAFGQQQGPRHCAVPREENGLIRGDRVPTGCVLVEDDSTLTSGEGGQRPYLVSEGTLFFTPNPTTVVLENGLRLSDGRLIIPRTPPLRQDSSDSPTPPDGFGPLQRHFGPLQRHFSPLQRHFGPLQRHFGPPQREFGARPVEFDPPPAPAGGR